jgi:hypothetical protein
MTPQPQRFPAFPKLSKETDLQLAVSRIDHSGRVGDRWLVDALGWQAGDHHDVVVGPDCAIMSVSPNGTYRINTRRHLFLPAAIRQGLGMDTNDRVVLVADLAMATLTVHTASDVAGVLLRHYSGTQQPARG